MSPFTSIDSKEPSYDLGSKGEYILPGQKDSEEEDLVDDSVAGVQGSDPVLICIYTRRRYAGCVWPSWSGKERKGKPSDESEMPREREKKKEASRDARDALLGLMTLEIQFRLARRIG